ncbi:MAG: NDP-sugar synthase [Dehalococcoidales bacterium]|nr:NDP-sugar synthase [Dehalococcoidales bacterium]
MKAVILVGGKATRLLPLTRHTPKSMVPVLNIPFLEHVIRHLGSHQVKEIVLAQGHLSQPIEDYFGDGSRFDVKLHYAVEDTPRGTGGAVKNAAGHLDDTFLVLNGDVFTDLDITGMVAFHRERQAKATIALTPVEDPTAYGLVETETDGRVVRFLEKPSWDEVLQRKTNMINAGTYILEPDILAQIPPEREVSIERETFQQLLAQEEPMYAYSSSAYWLDMGTPERYLQLHRDILDGKCPRCALAPDMKVVIEKPGNVHPAVRLEPPVVIGANCSIGEGVRLVGPVVIGAGSTILEDSLIENCIIWRNARLGPRVRLKDSILADNCRFGADTIGEGVVVGDNVTVLSGIKLEPGSKIEPGTTIG